MRFVLAGFERFGATKVRALAPFFALAAISACTASNGNQVENTLDVNQAPNADSAQASVQIAPQTTILPAVDPVQDLRGVCPAINVRTGTETFNIYPTGVKAEDEGAGQSLLYRATVTQTARECNSAGDGRFLNIRVGVRGRYISGPNGTTGSFSMPLRIAVTKGEQVLYSQLHQIDAYIPEGRTNGAFQYIDNNISIPKPDKRNVLIYVGFDEGPYDTP